jgi:DNA ligase (NAD+)
MRRPFPMSDAPPLMQPCGEIKRLHEPFLAKRTAPLGAEIAQSVYQWFHTVANQTLISRLQTMGLQLANSPETKAVGEINQKFAGKIFVITGTLPTLKREEAKALIQKSGGKITDSISKKTDFLVVGAEAGSKLEKAQNLGISQLTEAELLAMLAE